MQRSIELYRTKGYDEAQIANKHKPHGLKDNIKAAHDGGSIAKIAREQLEYKLVELVVSKDNRLNYEYKEDKLLEDIE